MEQAAALDPTYFLGRTAPRLEDDDAGAVMVTSHNGTDIVAKAVIITGGIGTFTPRPLPDGDEFEGRGLGYFVP